MTGRSQNAGARFRRDVVGAILSFAVEASVVLALAFIAIVIAVVALWVA